MFLIYSNFLQELLTGSLASLALNVLGSNLQVAEFLSRRALVCLFVTYYLCYMIWRGSNTSKGFCKQYMFYAKHGELIHNSLDFLH